MKKKQRDLIQITLIYAALALLGTALEFIADNQLADFRSRADPHGEGLLDTVLWGIVRYPNYLGEMLFWWGVAFCGLGAGDAWWVTIGAAAMVLLFVFVSIPMKDERMRERRSAFPDCCDRVPAFMPRW